MRVDIDDQAIWFMYDVPWCNSCEPKLMSLGYWVGDFTFGRYRFNANLIASCPDPSVSSQYLFSNRRVIR